MQTSTILWVVGGLVGVGTVAAVVASKPATPAPSSTLPPIPVGPAQTQPTADTSGGGLDPNQVANQVDQGITGVENAGNTIVNDANQLFGNSGDSSSGGS